MSKTYMIDPPSGWKYGFPRPYNKDTDGPMDAFLLKHGYPEKDIDFALNYMRKWVEESSNPSENSGS